MLKKIINMNEPMSKIEYLIVGMVIPIVLIILSLVSNFLITLLIFIPFFVMMSMIKRARSIGLNWQKILIFLIITVVLFSLLIKWVTPSYFDCTIKPIFYYVVFMPFQLVLFLMPNNNKKNIKALNLPLKFFTVIMSYILFFIVMIILEPFRGCALRSMSYQEKTCLQMGSIERTLIINNLDKLSTTNITIDDFNNLLSKEKNEYGLDAWGHKIKFEQYGNGFKLLTVMLDKNESEWVRQIVYTRNIDGVSNGCYVDKGLMERFFCKH